MEKGRKQSEFKFTTERRPEVDLRKYYTIFFQVGLIITLMVFIGLTRISITSSERAEFIIAEQEIVEMEEIIQTKQQPPVPPPPRPPVPVAVPNDVIIEDIDINIDAELDFMSDGHLPPPQQAREEEPEEEEDFFVVVEHMPELIGGLASLQEKVRYPELAVRANIQGRVVVQFIINERGEVENPQVVRGIGGGCDEEAVRVVKQARFTPGMQRGRPVRVQYSVPVTFVIR